MAKNIEDMIVPEKKRSIRDIPIPEGRRKAHSSSHTSTSHHKSHHAQDIDLQPKAEHRAPVKKSRKRFGKKAWFSTVLAIVILAFAGLSFFDGATLAYVPKSSSISFDSDVYRTKKAGDGEILFSVVKLSNDKSLVAEASGEVEVSRKASGTIIVYNTGTKSQRFRDTTRFATPDGKVYQIPTAVVVPARSSATVPGSIEVTVYAEKPGAESNIGLSDFTLPGLKGSTLFSTIYARSKTEMTGGYIGVEKNITEEERARVSKELKSALTENLLSEARAQVPVDFILIASLSSITFEDLPQTVSGDSGSAVVNMRGHLSGIMFKRSDLSTGLAEKKITLKEDESVDLEGLESLVFAFAGSIPSDFSTVEEISFSVTGEARAVWHTDEVALRADLLGKSKRDISSILRNYQAIASATVTTRPFWKDSFPEDGRSITIKKILD